MIYMDLRKIRKLIEIFNHTNLTEIEIHEGEESIRLSRATSTLPGSPQQQVVHVPMPDTQSVSEIHVDDDEVEDEHTISVLSPMVGTFFSSPSPTDDAFVKVGDSVTEGQPLCLIEAMKIFNQIEAEHSGTVLKILKDNGDPVEYGEPLFILSE